jgi:hypothetical protein
LLPFKKAVSKEMVFVYKASNDDIQRIELVKKNGYGHVIFKKAVMQKINMD